jgi:CheY-like chemotaxis protein
MKILIIDDEPLVRRSLVRVLTHFKHEVFEAENGEEGLAKWTEVQPNVVMLDVLMPIMGGLELLQKIDSKLLKSTKVILMSAHSGEHVLDSVQTRGAVLFLAKPFEDIFSVAKIVEDLGSK